MLLAVNPPRVRKTVKHIHYYFYHCFLHPMLRPFSPQSFSLPYSFHYLPLMRLPRLLYFQGEAPVVSLEAEHFLGGGISMERLNVTASASEPTEYRRHDLVVMARADGAGLHKHVYEREPALGTYTRFIH